ncbi:MAG: orotate phosphoribosyltransferase [Pseudomonadota bacterium]
MAQNQSTSEPQIEKQVAKLLIDLGCLQIRPAEPFTYASGLKGPIYCDNRQLLGFPKERSQVLGHFLKVIECSEVPFDRVAGLATAGIPHAALISDRLMKPLLYVRGESKAHGKKNQIEGGYHSGDKVIIIEDLVNQASSAAAAISALSFAGVKAMALYAIVDYEMDEAHDRMMALSVPLYSLTTFSAIVQTAVEQKIISPHEEKALREWQESPLTWGRHP